MKTVIHTLLQWQTLLVFLCMAVTSKAQTFEVKDGDTINVTDANGLKQGIWRSFYAFGQVQEELFYVDGKRHGLHLVYYRYPNCLKEESSYKNDTLDGFKSEYYNNCGIKFSAHYKAGNLNGLERTYNRFGGLNMEGQFKDGKLIGFYKKYKPDGSLDYETPERVSKINLEGYVTGEIELKDSLVIKSLTYLKPDANTVIVTDVTGSMYPYVGELLLWYNQGLENVQLNRFVFFNDGDKTTTFKKEVGKTGGIYRCKPKSAIELKKTMEKAIINGTGGDAPENDFEAIINAQLKFRKVSQVVLVADRVSLVRDYRLLSKIKVPVHVILCGDSTYINPQYIDLANKTGGSLVTLEEAIEIPKRPDNGHRLSIAGLTYELKRGTYKIVSPIVSP